MTDVILLAARTARSQAYAQMLRYRGIGIATALVYSDDKPRAGQAPVAIDTDRARDCSLPLPDLSEPLEATLADIAGQVLVLPVGHINDPEILLRVQQTPGDLLVYSGYGSQIVGAALLGLGLPMLHVHAGWLPQFRGSTTLYYELLSHNHCSASALLLAEQIDEGPVVARKAYPPPPPEVDRDYLYEPAIRADLLCDVLEALYRDGELPSPMEQEPEEAQTYYVIHPVLKHLAVLANKAKH